MAGVQIKIEKQAEIKFFLSFFSISSAGQESHHNS